MKKILLILLTATLILLPSCTTIPDEPLSPVDSGNEIENKTFSYPQIKLAETEIGRIKSDIEKNRGILQEYKIQISKTCEIAIEDTLYAFDMPYYEWSFLSDIASTGQEYDPNVVIFDETVFFPEESGAYVYLLLNLKRCEDSLKISEISEASLSNGTLKFTINVIPNPYFDPNKEVIGEEPPYETIILLKINKASLSGEIENLTVDFVYTEA